MKKSSQSRVVKHPLTPLQRCKTKKRPRGRPFPKGHFFGTATRFKKGEPSANPGGRPRSAKLNEANRNLLATTVPEEELIKHRVPKRLWGRTYAEILAWKMAQEGLGGKIGAIAELGDRAEGRPATSIHVDGITDPMSELLESVNAVRIQLYGEIERTNRKGLDSGDSGDSSGAVAGEEGSTLGDGE
jgi:hypothetical protein